MDLFHTKFTLVENTHPQRRRTVGTQAAMEQSIEKDPNDSIRYRTQQLEQCPSTLSNNE